MTGSIQFGSFAPSSKVVQATLCALMALWAAYLLLAPTVGFFWIDSWHNEQRAVQVVLLSLTAVVYALISPFGPDQLRARLRLPWWWLTFLALGVVSASLSHLPLAAFAEVGLTAMLGALVLVTAALTSDRQQLMSKAAQYCALLISGAHVLAVFVRYGAALQLGNSVDLSVFMLGYANPRFASALYAILMPFVAAVTIDTRRLRTVRLVSLVVLCLLWVINLGLGTRGIWFAYGIAAPALPLIVGRDSVRLVAAIALSAAIGLLLYFALTFGHAIAAGQETGMALSAARLQTLTSREVLWTLSWNAVAQHPILGLGPMHFATLNSHVGAHPHNWLLQISSEWGLPTLVLVLFVLLMAVKRLRTSHTKESNLSSEAVFAVSVALAYGLVDGNLVMPVSQTASALALGLVVGSLAPLQGCEFPARSRSAAIGIGTLAASIVVCVYAFQSFGNQPRATSVFRAEHPQSWLVPRFWENGLTAAGDAP